MPDIDPAALSRLDTFSQSISTSLLGSKSVISTVPLSVKTTKPSNSAQRIDLEPLYTCLKAAIGDKWGTYKEAISLFVLGHLNQNELSLRIDHFVTADPSTAHLHNQLIVAIYGNIIRDPPDQGVAPWVSANDKPMVLSKPVSGDAAEQRLKTEVMQLPARERRRLKEVPDVSHLCTLASGNDARRAALKLLDGFSTPTMANTIISMQFEVTDLLAHGIATSVTEYHLAKQIRLPDTVPASAGGLNKTSNPLPNLLFSLPSLFQSPQTDLTLHSKDWDLEIRKRYSQPLASETGEFPDADAIYGRMVPICYEESLPNGCAPTCAELMATATEQFIKAVLSSILARTRSNIPAAGGNGISTRKYRRQLEREEEGLQKGEVMRGLSNGLLPIEAREASMRRGLGMGDLRLAVRVGGCELGQMPGIVKSIMGGWEEGVLEGWGRTKPAVGAVRNQEVGVQGMEMGGARTNGVTNGGPVLDDDPDDVDDRDWGWDGGGSADRAQLGCLLDGVLAGGS